MRSTADLTRKPREGLVLEVLEPEHSSTPTEAEGPQNFPAPKPEGPQMTKRICTAVASCRSNSTRTVMTDDEAPRLTPRQLRHVHGLWGQIGMDRDERLAITSQIIGRKATSSNDLTVAEASVLIDKLHQVLGIPVRERNPQ